MGIARFLLFCFCSSFCSLVSMEPPSQDEDTAIYNSTGSQASPGASRRSFSFINLLLTPEQELQATPRIITSFLYAVMDKYTIDPHATPPLISFHDYLDPQEQHTVTLPMASGWIQTVRKILDKKYTQEKPIVNPNETRVGVRDLEWAQKKFLVFLRCTDFIDSDVLSKNYNALLLTTRTMRIDGFANQNVCVLVCSQYHSVQYCHLGSPDEEYPPPEKYKCGNCLCTIL